MAKTIITLSHGSTVNLKLMLNPEISNYISHCFFLILCGKQLQVCCSVTFVGLCWLKKNRLNSIFLCVEHFGTLANVA